jgi:hypothetical protein
MCLEDTLEVPLTSVSRKALSGNLSASFETARSSANFAVTVIVSRIL